MRSFWLRSDLKPPVFLHETSRADALIGRGLAHSREGAWRHLGRGVLGSRPFCSVVVVRIQKTTTMTTASILPTSKATVALEIVEPFKTKIDDSKITFHPNIPHEMMEKVTATYAKTAKENGETILCVLNETVFAGNAADGFAVTEQALYWHNMGESDGMVPLSEIQEIVYEKGLLAKLLKINGKHKILTTTPKPQSMELVVGLVNALRSGAPVKTSAAEQPAATTENAPTLESAQNRSRSGGAKFNKKKFAAICILALAIFLLLPVLLPTSQNDESVALAAVEIALQQQQLTPRITQYVFTPNEKGGVLIVEHELINALNDQWLGNYYYQADVKIDDHKKAEVLSLTKIDYPGNLNWTLTKLGKQRQSEAERRLRN